MPMLLEEVEEPVKLHEWNIIPKERPQFCPPAAERLKKLPSIVYPTAITWNVSDVAKAARLLKSPPLPTNFNDEEEMRRVYTLIFDVFRHKNILITALDDCSFFEQYSILMGSRSIVWLLLYDLYHRNFKRRDSQLYELAANLFKDSGILEIDNAVWEQRVHLAAAIARVRIKNNALRLSDLLPKHLRDRKVDEKSAFGPITCWINVNKVKNKEEIVNQLRAILNVNPLEEEKDDLELEPNRFKWDKICPHFIFFHSSLRRKLTQSQLVQKHKLIVQDRSFCLGPAAFGKVVGELDLRGSVIQSHVHSPRATAYLANLLSENAKITHLLVFSAGSRKPEYEDYFNKIGAKNVSFFSEKLFECQPDNYYLEEAAAVFVTPPNSYSAVNDPIDLVCSRGGDLNLLETLTESELMPEGRRRIHAILEEQKKTLQFAMTKPQIQVVLYETHSEIEAENNKMVGKTLDYINKVTQLKHAVRQGKINVSDLPADALIVDVYRKEKCVDQNKLIKKYLDVDCSSDVSLVSVNSRHSLENIISQEVLKDVDVPPTDIFERPKRNDLCSNNIKKEGCFLALIQRKEITRLDDKLLINIAENRGLFGKDSESTGKTKGNKTNRKKKRSSSPRTSKQFKRNQPIEISRIAAPTLAFKRQSDPGEPCPKDQEKVFSTPKVPQSRRWWGETTRHLTSLRERLINQKVLPTVTKLPHSHANKFVNALVQNSRSIDQIAAQSAQKNNGIPIFPRLRLTRQVQKPEKVPLPIAVTVVQFPFRRF